MKKLLEQSFENLIHQLKASQYNGKMQFPESTLTLSTLNTLIPLVEQFRIEHNRLRRQNEEAVFAYQTLEVAYQRYWEFFNYAPDGYMVTDTNGIIKEVNQTILSMISGTRDSLIGKSIITLIPEIGVSGIQLNWVSGSQQLEVRMNTQRQNPFYVSINIAPQCNIQNQPIGLFWLIRDISERKAMEDTLRKNQAELSLILEQIPCILWTTDLELNVTSISGTGLTGVYLSPDEIIGHHFWSYFKGGDEQAVFEAHEQALLEVQKSFELEWQGYIFQSTVEALKNNTGQIIGVIGAAFDITERKKAEKTLQKSEKFNASLLEKSPTPIIVIDQNTTICYVNPALEKLTGFSAKKLIGKSAPYPWWIKNDSYQSVEQFKQRLVRKTRKQEKVFRKKNGDKFWVENSSIMVSNEGEPGYYLQTWIDITEAKHLRENMEFYVMQITKIQEEERKRVAQELHEETLQSLAALCLATEAIIKSMKSSDVGTINKDLSELREKISCVIEDVRKFSYGLRPGVLDYLGLLAALETLNDEVNAKGIHGELVITGKEKHLSADMEITLFRIAQEAVSNIKKYSQASKVNISVNYTPTKIRLIVEDNGIGFKLPEGLSDLANEGKLGILGMEERARLYGGSFSIESQLNKGTKIVITLPLHSKSK